MKQYFKTFAIAVAAMGVVPAGVQAADAIATAPPIPTLESRIDPETAVAGRIALWEKLDSAIESAFSAPLDEATEKTWPGAYWAAELKQDRGKLVLDALRLAMEDFPSHSEDFRRATLEAASALFPQELVPEMRRVLAQEKDEKRFAMAAYYLLRAEPTDKTHRRIEKELRRFPAADTHPILRALKRRLAPPSNAATPSLTDLLAYPFAPAGPVVFSLQRPDRRRTGLAVVRGADGRFIRQPDGTLFAVPQLALALSNMPGTITNGNTPQGVFSISGMDVSTNVFIGTTPMLVSRLPFEAPPTDFFHGTRTDTAWSIDLYKKLLPQSWQNQPGMMEAFDAGEAGRSEIVIHGTTIDPGFYIAQPYYPQTPSMGCLCTAELWDINSGKALASDQLALLRAYAAAGGGKGYLVVVELEDVPRPVALDDVRLSIFSAEGPCHLGKKPCAGCQ